MINKFSVTHIFLFGIVNSGTKDKNKNFKMKKFFTMSLKIFLQNVSADANFEPPKNSQCRIKIYVLPNLLKRSLDNSLTAYLTFKALSSSQHFFKSMLAPSTLPWDCGCLARPCTNLMAIKITRENRFYNN
ncbi:hypothetical protein BpHYR1_027820 [Brachionus plicatilis]|uniref:Uncharacterized protein n=1 Tax=Brachionus plicatilis TaxID=10195 RepID=A0A3M7PGU7_BRAPC|nr:hypothetical protein BpHYR1_027820 [Brachionus plicatilis]